MTPLVQHSVHDLAYHLGFQAYFRCNFNIEYANCNSTSCLGLVLLLPSADFSYGMPDSNVHRHKFRVEYVTRLLHVVCVIVMMDRPTRTGMLSPAYSSEGKVGVKD